MFKRVLQIVDSETVLCMLNKTSTRFKVYQGVRIGGRTPEELDNDSCWWNGPPILYTPVEEWGLKFKPKKEEMRPGEKVSKVKSNTS